MTPSKVIWSRPGRLTIYAPISVVCLTLHTCMEQMLEKGGGLAVKMFSKGLVLSQDCPNPLKWHTDSVLLC